MRHLLINESNPAGLAAIPLAAGLGVRTTFLTTDVEFYRRESPYADEAFETAEVIRVSPTLTMKEKWQTVESINRSRRIDGICTPSEYHIVETATFARHLGLPALSVEGATNCRFKQRTREALSRHGLPQPDFRHI